MRRFLATSALQLACSVAALGAPAAVSIHDAAGDAAALRRDLHALCDVIGPRMAGTEGMQRALEWAADGFEAAGIPAVRLEAVPMPLRWEEGPTRVDVIEPTSMSVRAAASALSPAVPVAVEGEVVDGGAGRPGYIARRAAAMAGKILLVELQEVASFDDLAAEQRDAMVAISEAAAARALAVLFVSTRPHRLLYRHVNNVAGRLDRVPSALVAREDGLRLLRLLRGGIAVRARIAMPNRVGGPYETANVIAEIPGGDLPDEIVLLGAHLDSWDMGTGCLDNAANAAMVMHVARSIRAAGASHRRTLRFALFGGEELGLFGSLAYVDEHLAELDRHVAAIVHDMGDGPLLGYAVGGRDELLPKLDRILGVSGPAGVYRHTREAYFLSDNFTFALQGVPALFAVQDTSDFILSYHSEADTRDKVRVANIRDAAVTAATLALGIANSEERFGERLAAERVTAWLRRAGLVRHLRFLDVWEAWGPRPAPRFPGAR